MNCKPLRLMNVWVKAPLLRGADLLIASACLPAVNQELFMELSRGRVALLACPEEEQATHYGKIANIIRSSKPRSITVVTIEGSPHCFTLHASINAAEYLLGTRIQRKHYVVVDGRELVEISPEAVRIARYLHLVDRLVKENPWILEELGKHSLEHRAAEKQ